MSIERSFLFPFRAPRAGSTLVLGGFFSLLFPTVFFTFTTVGYLMRVFCNALDGRDVKLPAWRDFGSLFVEGLQPVLVGLAYSAPVVVLLIVELNLLVQGTATGSFVLPIAATLALFVTIVLPPAIIRHVVRGSLGAAFELGKILGFVKQNPGIYFKTWALALASSLVSAALSVVVLMGVGAVGEVGGDIAAIGALIVFAFVFFLLSFTTNVIIVHLFAQAYRASIPFADDSEGKKRASMTVPPPLKK